MRSPSPSSRSAAVFVTTDLIGLPRAISDEVEDRVRARFKLERDALVLSSSHTHCGPAVRKNLAVLYDFSDEDRKRVDAYGDVPALKVAGKDGSLRAALFGYACHNTTLGGDFYRIGGDYAGFAQAEVQRTHPGATAMFVMLCGGDQNPDPRGTLALAERHGQALAAEVGRVLGARLLSVRPPIRTAYEVVALELAPHARGLRAGGRGHGCLPPAESAADARRRRRRETDPRDAVPRAGRVPRPSLSALSKGPAMASSNAAALPIIAATILASSPVQSQEETVPRVDRRAEVLTLDSPRTFTPYADRDAWLARARFLREQILVSAGLWPMPEKGPLNAQLFGRIERRDYSVEKVYFESYPGFYVTGNLYRPLGKSGPFPGVLSPHGHWAYGRLENGADGSIPARCISLARQGYVVFSYDMVGYNDSRQVDHRLMDPRLAQWGIGSLGLHLWNSIRSVDFLESLPDVDRGRLACTGASGGGTQTFLLTAVDERIKASAPVNMISHYMQGGDVCENAPNLRLDTSNMEIGALMAPRPMLMVSAAGDWTRDTPRIEFPAVQSVYSLLGAKDQVATVQFIADHNYNRDSREAVYGFFARWVLGRPDTSPIREPEYAPELPADLLVFFGRELPKEAKTPPQIVDGLVAARKARLAALRPGDAAGLARLREVLEPGLRHVLAAELPAGEAILESPSPPGVPPGVRDLVIGRRGRGDRVSARVWSPPPEARRSVLVVHPDGVAGASAREDSLIDPLRRQGYVVTAIDAFNTGSARVHRDTTDRFFTTYNRTDDANRVQDILTTLAWLKRQPGVRGVSLVGLERAGLWCLLAQALAPGLEAVVGDAAAFPTGSDEAYADRVFIPLLRSVGGFETALTLGLGTRILVHDTGGAFDTTAVEASARATGAAERLRVSREKLADSAVVSWVTGE